MNIEQSTVRKIRISQIKGLDPISVYLEDFKPRDGKITISCYDKSWHSRWGGMGDRTISEFFLSCDNHYLAKNLSRIRASVNDYDALGEKIKEHYGEEVDWCLKDEIDSMGDNHEWEVWVMNNANVLREVYGDDWCYCIPEKANHEYTYLCRIIDTVKEALRIAARTTPQTGAK